MYVGLIPNLPAQSAREAEKPPLGQGHSESFVAMELFEHWITQHLNLEFFQGCSTLTCDVTLFEPGLEGPKSLHPL